MSCQVQRMQVNQGPVSVTSRSLTTRHQAPSRPLSRTAHGSSSSSTLAKSCGLFTKQSCVKRVIRGSDRRSVLHERGGRGSVSVSASSFDSAQGREPGTSSTALPAMVNGSTSTATEVLPPPPADPFVNIPTPTQLTRQQLINLTGAAVLTILALVCISFHPLLWSGSSTAAVETALQRLDYFGTVVFAFSGALKAGRLRMDLMGVLALGTCTGVGGGTLRDVLLGNLPTFWLHQTEYLYICVVTSALVFACARFKFMTHPLTTKLVMWGDALGLGAFAVIGARAGLSSGMALLPCAMFGMMTATFGGLIRDVCMSQPPVALTKGEVYATSAFLGACGFLAASQLTQCVNVGILWGVTTTVAVRAAAFTYDLRLPSLPVLWER